MEICTDCIHVVAVYWTKMQLSSCKGTKTDETTLVGRHSESGQRFELGCEAKTSNLHQQRDQRQTLLLSNDFIWSTRRTATEPWRMWDEYQKPEISVILPRARTHKWSHKALLHTKWILSVTSHGRTRLLYSTSGATRDSGDSEREADEPIDVGHIFLGSHNQRYRSVTTFTQHLRDWLTSHNSVCSGCRGSPLNVSRLLWRSSQLKHPI